MSKIHTPVAVVTGKRPISIWRQKFVRVQFKLLWYLILEVRGDQFSKSLFCLVPAFVSNDEASGDKYWLLVVVKVFASAACFINIKKVRAWNL